MDKMDELRKKLVQQTRRQVTIEYGEKERHVIRAANALEDLDSSSNLLFEHCREWYHVFFPELERTVNDPETFLKLVYKIGNKQKFLPEEMEDIVTNPELQTKIVMAAQESVGAPEEKNALREIQLLALNTLNLKEQRKFLEKFVESQMNELAPNFSRLAGTLLGAKILAKVGSVSKLAEKTGSTLQLIGAEKALFRHLKAKRKERPPKYGFLFGHPLVKQLPAGHKGKMARSLAAKLAIAARADAFGKQPIAEKLEKQLQARFEQLQKTPVKPKPRFEPQRGFAPRPSFQPRPSPFQPRPRAFPPKQGQHFRFRKKMKQFPKR